MRKRRRQALQARRMKPEGYAMNPAPFFLIAALSLTGCTTAPANVNLTDQDTRTLCRMVFETTDPARREQIASLIVRRGASAERCQSLVAADNAIMTGIVVAGAAAAAGAAANSGYGGGYAPSAYGVAWDQFYNEYYQTIWRCRDRATGRFVEDYRCAGKPMVDSTWPGWSA